jgi:hypothetical protein
MNKEVHGMTTTIKSRSVLATVPSGPAIDSAQALWATRELNAIIQNLGADSPVAMVLRHAQREIASLTTSAGEQATVIGPFRVAA